MGEILEEGDKADGEKKEGGEGEEGADNLATMEKKEGVTEEPAVVKEVLFGIMPLVICCSRKYL